MPYFFLNFMRRYPVSPSFFFKIGQILDFKSSKNPISGFLILEPIFRFVSLPYAFWLMWMGPKIIGNGPSRNRINQFHFPKDQKEVLPVSRQASKKVENAEPNRDSNLFEYFRILLNRKQIENQIIVCSGFWMMTDFWMMTENGDFWDTLQW